MILPFYLFLIMTGPTFGQWSSVGTPQSFTFEAIQNEYVSFTWLLQKEDNNVTLFICNTFMLICNPYSDEFLDSYSANITKKLSSYVSVFTVKSMSSSQYNIRWFCIVNSKVITESTESGWFYLKFYDAAESPTCYDVTLYNENTIQINCSTQKVVPGSICQFYIKTNTTPEYELSTSYVTYAHKQNVTNGYYRTKCTYTAPATTLGPGSHKFRVVMHPDIPATITEDMKTASRYTQSIAINYPKAVLAADCHVQDYVKEFQETNCTCFDNNTSFLPTQVTWSTGTSNNGILTFYPDRNTIVAMNFQCTVTNVLGVNNTILYRPTVAYPPNPSLSLLNTSFDLCVDKNISITGRCPDTEGYPVSTVSIYINNYQVDTHNIYSSSLHEFSTTYTSSGVVNVTCVADNVEFSISRTQYIYITGPPDAPTLQTLLRRDSVSSPDKTQQAIIMCQSKGGFPNNKELTLTCDSYVAKARDSDTVSLQVTMTTTPTDVNCTCDVWHQSKCLQNRTTGILRLYVIDSPSEINSAAIAIGVVLGLCVVGLTVAIIVIVMRNKRNHGADSSSKKGNTQTRPDYNSIKATPYINTEQHGYLTVNNNSSYLNEALSATPDRPNTTIRKEKDDHTYDEIAEIQF